MFKSKGVLEDVVVYVDSWNIIIFMVLKPKSNLGGYPLILGRPWLAMKYAYIGCRSRDMTEGCSFTSLSLQFNSMPSSLYTISETCSMPIEISKGGHLTSIPG
jgi:hypothetical protein